MEHLQITTSDHLDETQLDAVNELIKLRGFNQRINKKSSSERRFYVWSEQIDFLKYFAKEWIQY